MRLFVLKYNSQIWEYIAKFWKNYRLIFATLFFHVHDSYELCIDRTIDCFTALKDSSSSTSNAEFWFVLVTTRLAKTFWENYWITSQPNGLETIERSEFRTLRRMWPQTLEMSRDECRGMLRRLGKWNAAVARRSLRWPGQAKNPVRATTTAIGPI